MICYFRGIFDYVKDLETVYSGTTDISKIKRRFVEILTETIDADGEKDFDPRGYDTARFAIVAWLDEKMMNMEGIDAMSWSESLLQKHFYNTSNAGELFYQRLMQVNNKDVLEVYFVCLLLGFRGKYGRPSQRNELQETIGWCKRKYLSLLDNCNRHHGREEIDENELVANYVGSYRLVGRYFVFGAVFLSLIVYWCLRASLENTITDAFL